MGIIKNYNLSIILPFYDHSDKFIKTFYSESDFFYRNGIEIVIILLSRKNVLLRFTKQYPLINWKVIISKTSQTKQTISYLINAGICQASMDFILIMNPELEFNSGIIHQLQKKVWSYPYHFVVGQTNSYKISEGKQNSTHCFTMSEFLMVRKNDLKRVGGYDEKYDDWEEISLNLFARLELLGIKKLFVPEAILYKQQVESSNTNKNKQVRTTNIHLKDILLPKKANIYIKSKHDSDQIIYEFKQRPFPILFLMEYLKNFENWTLSDNATKTTNYKLILLVPTFNEELRIIDFMRHIESKCDGIIMLDDGSADGTYEQIESHKLLLKVKKRRFCFNDLENRNILLKLAAFFNSEWFLFIDVDERFDERFETVESITKRTDIDTVGFWVINLWDNEKYYRSDINDSHYLSNNGLIFRWRIFRKKGFMQLMTNRRLHFITIPYLHNTYISKILIKHYGCLSKILRKNKHSFYMKEDTETYDNYIYLMEETVQLREVRNINREDLKYKKFSQHKSSPLQ
jgi:hypothetical protein